MIGLAGQFAAVEEAMTGRENLEMVGRLFGLSRKDAKDAAVRVLDQMQLTADADRLVRTYSGGMRRRIDLLLDEPSAGLDPGGRIQLWDAIRGLVVTGTDILLTTQYLDEADRLASDIVIIDHGKVVAAGTPAELKTRAGDDMIEVHVHDADALPAVSGVLAKIGYDPRVDFPTRRAFVSADNGSARLMEALRVLDQQGITVEDISLRRPTLDEVFLALTGKPAKTTDSPEQPAGA